MTTEKVKPTAKVVGQNGNVFNLIGICNKVLQKAGQFEEAKKMQAEVKACGSYDEVLVIMGKYCNLQ